jgi:hypothetical protein
MAVVPYQQRNKDNLTALIDFMFKPGSKEPYEIGYLQEGSLVLLGKGHSKADEDKIRNTGGEKYEGKLEFRQESGGVFYVRVKPKGAQTSGKAELEKAVRQTVESTRDYLNWGVIFKWE